MKDSNYSIRTIGRIISILCYFLALLWAYLFDIKINYFLILIFGGLIVFGSYFLMFEYDFYSFLREKIKRFKISYKLYMLLLIVFISPMLYILTTECLLLLSRAKGL